MPYNNQGIGYQKNRQSLEAEQYNATGKLTIREQVKIAFETFGDMTVEELCDVLQRDRVSVQPRITELKKQGVLEDSGATKMGKYGTNITVWRIAE